MELIRTSKKTTLGEYVTLEKSETGKNFLVILYRSDPRENEDLWTPNEQKAISEFEKAEKWLLSRAVEAARSVEPTWLNPKL